MKTSQIVQEKLNKKGQIIGDLTKIYMAILVLAVVVISAFVGVEVLSRESVIPRTAVSGNDVIRNETIVINATSQIPVTLRNLTGCAFRSGWPELRNETGNATTKEVLINSANYTVSACGIVASGSASAPFNGTTANVSGYYTYTVPSAAVYVTANVTGGSASFFNQTPTIMSVMGVVIIISVIMFVVWAVNRFTSGGKSAAAGL